MFAKFPTAALVTVALSLLYSPVTASVGWGLAYTTPTPRDKSRCAEFKVFDDAINGWAQTISGRFCNGYDHNGDQQWTFDFPSGYHGYSATIHQESFYVSTKWFLPQSW